MKAFYCLGIKSTNTYRIPKVSVRLYSTDNMAKAELLMEMLKINKDFLREKKFLDRYDRSNQYEFQHKPLLDATARVLSYQDPCTAVVKQKNIIKVSYNEPIGYRIGQNIYKDENPQRDSSALLAQRVNKLINEASLRFNEDVSSDSLNSLLSLTLRHSTAFSGHISELRKIKYAGISTTASNKAIEVYKEISDR